MHSERLKAGNCARRGAPQLDPSGASLKIPAKETCRRACVRRCPLFLFDTLSRSVWVSKPSQERVVNTAVSREDCPWQSRCGLCDRIRVSLDNNGYLCMVGNTFCSRVLQQRQSTSTGWASSVRSSRTATLTCVCRRGGRQRRHRAGTGVPVEDEKLHIIYTHTLTCWGLCVPDVGLKQRSIFSVTGTSTQLSCQHCYLPCLHRLICRATFYKSFPLR